MEDLTVPIEPLSQRATPAATSDSAPQAEAVPPTIEPSDLTARRAQRQQELLVAKLADSDPKQALFGAAALEALEFTALLKSTLMEAVATNNDPVQRLEKLLPGVRLYGNMIKLAEKLM